MKKSYALLLATCISTLSIAGPNPAVTHTHDGRTHTHPLPDSGLNHTHNKGNGSSGSSQAPRKPTNQPKWVLMVKSNETYPTAYYVQLNSLKIDNNQVNIIGRANSSAPNNKTETLYRWSIAINDCRRKQGKFNVADANGKFLYSNDFVYGEGDIASNISEQLCDAALG